jgi:O-antigen/teichoic acid export membrane protein
MRRAWASVFQSSFLRSVTVLVSGTAFSQVILLLALPVLTRLYTPEDFGALGVYLGLVMVVSVAACLRFDIAIPLPESARDAGALLCLALISAMVSSGLLAFAIFYLGDALPVGVDHEDFRGYLWLVPIGVLVASIYSALQFWATRVTAFPLIARTRIIQSLGAVGTQIGMGMAGIAPLGLFLGQVVNLGAGIAGLSRRAISDLRRAVFRVSFPELRRVAHEYRRFPQYSTWEALANSAGTHLPVIAIAVLASGAEAGFLVLAMRVMAAPMSLIGGAIAQVYLSRAPGYHRGDSLGQFAMTTIGGLVRGGAGPLIFAGIVAPPFFAVVFGEEWRRAGTLVSWMTPWFVMQFLTSPVSMTLHVINMQRTALGLQLLGVTVRLGAVVVASLLTFGKLAEFFAVSSFVFYAIYLATLLHLLAIKAEALWDILKHCLPQILGWCVIGVLFRVVMEGLVGT